MNPIKLFEDDFDAVPRTFLLPIRRYTVASIIQYTGVHTTVEYTGHGPDSPAPGPDLMQHTESAEEP